MTEDSKALYISCERFGGSRCALGCAHFDRYRACRKNCKSLEEFMRNTSDLVEQVSAYYKDKTSPMTSRRSCIGLPLQEYRCKFCRFVAKSERGLKKHMTMSHKT